jgi:hypothetical protein
MQAFRTSRLFAVFVGMMKAEEQLFSLMSFTLQKKLFLTAANELQVMCFVKIGRNLCKKEVCYFGIYICAHVAVI